jgi:hypothetical protein
MNGRFSQVFFQKLIWRIAICIYFSCRENNYLNLQSYFWYTALFFLWYISHIWIDVMRQSQSLQAYGYNTPKSVETGCSRYLFGRYNIKFSPTNVFLSFDMLIRRISQLWFSMTIYDQIYSEPILIVSSIITIFLELTSLVCIFESSLWMQNDFL